MVNEESIQMKKTGIYIIPIFMLIANSLVSIPYNSDSAFMFVLSYFLGYASFLGYFVMLVIVLLNQHKLLEFQKPYIDIAFILGIFNIFVGIGTYVVVSILK